MCYSSPITYDAIGNPLSYWNGTLTLEGRQLKTLTKGSISASYKYDAQGLRSYKKVGTEESRYFYLGGKLTYEERGTKKFWYHYDALGALNGLTYKNGTAAETNYLVYTNNRGDVEALYTVEGRLYARYNYDAWGNTVSVTKLNGDAILPTATEIAYLNPIRYRGYYFDQESGLYYLKSRYYDPQVKRFLNPDSIIFTPGLIGHNIFTYCNNNPVNMIDSGGKRPLSLTDNPGEETPLPDNYYAGPTTKPSTSPSPQPGPAPKSTPSPANVTDDADALAAINSKKNFRYKGVEVKRHDVPGLTSFAIGGTVYLNVNVNKATISSKDKLNTLKHEYGHTVQEALFGEALYITDVAIPSVSNAYKGMSDQDYYSQPWEWWADKLGGADRGSNFYNSGASANGAAYMNDILYMR